MKTINISIMSLGTVLMLAAGGPAAYATTTCTPTGFVRDGINMTAASINPGDVTGPVDATGCNIGIYYGAGNTGTVDAAEVFGANYFGIVVNADNGSASVDVTNSVIHDIGENPLNGTQHGVAIYYRACTLTSSATGTIAGNDVASYQKGGIVVSCAGTAVSISGNSVHGEGPVDYIAQNGIQVGYGAAAQVTRNTVTGNAYSGANNASSAGILIVGGPCFGAGMALTTGIQNVRNTLVGNDVGVWLANLDTNCSAPSTSTNNKVINNVITNDAVTNVSGNGSSGYQAGISDTGVNDKLIGNTISGLGYAGSSCGSTCAIDTSTSAGAKVHANQLSVQP